MVGNGRRRLRRVVADAISDVAGARPVRQHGRIAVELVADDDVQLPDGLQATGDGFIHCDFGRDVRADSAGLFGRDLFKAGDELGEPFDEIRRHFVFQEGRP